MYLSPILKKKNMTDFSFGQDILHLPISPRGVWRHVEALGYWLNSAASRYDQPTLSRVRKQMVWCISEIKPGSRWHISWIIELDSGWLLSLRTTSAGWSLLIKQWEHQIVQQHWDCLQLRPLVPNNKITPAHRETVVAMLSCLHFSSESLICSLQVAIVLAGSSSLPPQVTIIRCSLQVT